MTSSSLIVGLGNPGKEYEKTRHNMGFRVVDALARESGLTLRRKWMIQGRMAHGEVGGKDVYLLEPTSYMNRSGPVVAQVLRKLGLDVSRLLVVVDDVALPFGDTRMRAQGSAGGHNGLKSVEECLGTNDYARLRIGVGDRRENDLASYVLAPFTPKEELCIPELVERAVSVIQTWLTEGITSAMNRANAKCSSQP